jgi:hypothetical protein
MDSLLWLIRELERIIEEKDEEIKALREYIRDTRRILDKEEEFSHWHVD